MSLQLSSSAFTPDHPIPPVYTCEGRNISPPLAWNGLPPQTKSLALIVDDPDAPDPKAPKMTWVHWVLYNIPSETAGLPEDATETGLPSGTKQGLNNWNRVGYGGPCPPIGTHRYFFKLYALDTTLPDLGEVSKKQLVEAMEKHLLGQAQLMGTYRKVKGK